MNYETLKTAADASLEGVKVEFVTEDGSQLRGVQLTDAKGNQILIRSSGGYSDTVKVMRPETFSVETRHVVTADLPGGIKIREAFADDAEAGKRVEEIRAGQNLGWGRQVRQGRGGRGQDRVGRQGDRPVCEGRRCAEA